MKKVFAVICLTLGGLMLFAAPATATAGRDKVTICHATHSDKNPYVEITVAVPSVVFNGHDGHSGDIIPAFGEYPGKNLNLLDVLNNGCSVPETTTTTVPCEETTTTTVPETTTTTVPETTTTTVPVTTTTVPQVTTTVPETSVTTPVPATEEAVLARTGVPTLPLVFFGVMLLGIGFSLLRAKSPSRV